jgi:hypothetical protein
MKLLAQKSRLCCHTSSLERVLEVAPVGETSLAMRGNIDGGPGILPAGSLGAESLRRRPAAVGSKTLWRQPACTALRADTVELVGKTSAGK